MQAFVAQPVSAWTLLNCDPLKKQKNKKNRKPLFLIKSNFYKSFPYTLSKLLQKHTPIVLIGSLPCIHPTIIPQLF